jgi:feruloyl esterase
MNHCSGGPATDQADFISPLVAWVERGQAPGHIVATARGAGNPGGTNADLPPDWSPTRTRPLCPYPTVARYVGGNAEQASSWACDNGRPAGRPAR